MMHKPDRRTAQERKPWRTTPITTTPRTGIDPTRTCIELTARAMEMCHPDVDGSRISRCADMVFDNPGRVEIGEVAVTEGSEEASREWWRGRA